MLYVGLDLSRKRLDWHAARTYIGARCCGAGGLVGALAAAHSPTRQVSLSGALGARRKLSPIVWALMVRTSRGGGFRLLRLRAGRGSCAGRSCGQRSVGRGRGRSA